MEPFKSGPVQELKFQGFSPLRSVHILRDDLIHPIVCGNKWRKLKYVIPYLKEHHMDNLVTFGGAYSNHLVATAFAGKQAGIRTHAFVRGAEERELNHYERTCIENGMLLTHVNRSDYKDKRKLFEQFYGDNRQAFFLDEGGDHPLALPGCAEIIEELETVYDYIVLPLGTGTTMQGLLKGVTDKGLHTKILGISSLKNNHALDKKMEGYGKAHWHIFHEYHRGKYGSRDEELMQFITDFSAATQVPLEFVYTGKMVMGFIDLIAKGYFKPSDKILLIHTGGLLNVV